MKVELITNNLIKGKLFLLGSSDLKGGISLYLIVEQGH